MKFVIAREDLLKAISYVQNTVSQKPILPVLSNFLLEADDEITISATDLTISIKCFIPAKVFSKGSTTLPAKKFFQLIKEIHSHQIEISCSESHITEIFTERSKFKMNGMSKEQFPSIQDGGDSQDLKISQGKLKELLFKTSFSVSRDETRVSLSGLLLEIKNNQLVVVATDGKRLAKSTLSQNIDSNISGRFVVPIKAIEDVYKILKDNNDEIMLQFMEDKLSLETDQFKLVTKLLNVQFPNFEHVIPTDVKHSVLVDKDEFYSLLKQVSLFTSENNLSVKFTFSDGSVLISTSNPEIGECNVVMPIHFQGPKLEISFNPNFIMDILKHCFDKQVWLCLNDTYSPGLIKDSSGSVYVLMPMRTESV